MVQWKLWFRKKFPTHVERRILTQIKGKTLDIGCGKGLFSYYCQSKGLDIVGLDISREKIREARMIANKPFILGDARKLPFKDNIFDNVVAIDVIEHIRDSNKTIEEIKRVLKRNGKAFFHIPRKKSVFRHMEGHVKFFDKSDVKKLLGKHFKIEKSECVGFRVLIRPPLINPSFNPFWILSTFITKNLPEFLSTHYYFETKKV